VIYPQEQQFSSCLLNKLHKLFNSIKNLYFDENNDCGIENILIKVQPL